MNYKKEKLEVSHLLSHSVPITIVKDKAFTL